MEKQYYVTFRVETNPLSRQKIGGSKYYMIKCKDNCQANSVKKILKDGYYVKNIRVGCSPIRQDKSSRTIIDAETWIKDRNALDKRE